MKLLLLLLFVWPASAAAEDPALCRPYASRSIDTVMKFAWTRLYSHCLLMDQAETPVSTWDELATIVSPPGDAPALGSSGAAPGTPEWQRWCRTNFPRSWDAKTGTVILEITNRGKRVPCPG